MFFHKAIIQASILYFYSWFSLECPCRIKLHQVSLRIFWKQLCERLPTCVQHIVKGDSSYGLLMTGCGLLALKVIFNIEMNHFKDIIVLP